MRNVPPFSCPQCGDSSLGSESCLRCSLRLVDKNGVPSLAPVAKRFADARAWFWLPFLNASRGHRVKLTCRALEVSPIGRASGRCRVRGRVHVLRSVTENPGLGAILKRTRTRVEEVQRTPDFADPGATTSHTVIDELATCGRFAVVDDSGVAVVDEDAFELWVSPGVAVPWNKACALMVRDGDEVEVIGPTRRELVSDSARLFSAVDYRSDAHHALVFDGTAKDRVLILATTCTLPS